MTVLVGIQCKDGVVIASDSAATFGANGHATIGQQSVQKVSLIQDRIVFAGTGAVGIAQLIIQSLDAGWTAGVFKNIKSGPDMMRLIGVRIGETVAPFLQTGKLQHGLTGEASASLCKSLIALPVVKKFKLFQFDFGGAPEQATEQLPFIALGSGQAIADPFLALLKGMMWSESVPTLAEGRLAAIWTIDHVRRTNPGGVGGEIQLATLTDATESIKMADSGDVDEHLQVVQNGLKALVKEIRGFTDPNVAPIPPPEFNVAPAQ